MAQIAQAGTKGPQRRIGIGRAEQENADARDLPSLLPLGGERRGEKAASQGADEPASVQWSPLFGRVV
jgi:hypothetical protein